MDLMMVWYWYVVGGVGHQSDGLTLSRILNFAELLAVRHKQEGKTVQPYRI